MTAIQSVFCLFLLLLLVLLQLLLVVVVLLLLMLLLLLLLLPWSSVWLLHEGLPTTPLLESSNVECFVLLG